MTKDIFDNRMGKGNLIIFCQAPADVHYTLTICHQNIGKKITIYAVNVYSVYKFLCGLNLNVEQIVYIPYAIASLRSPSLLLKERRRLTKMLKAYFFQVVDTDVYFFSKYEDWLTAYFIHNLYRKPNNRIIYANHYDDAGNLFPRNKEKRIYKFMYTCVLKYLTGVDFTADVLEKLPEFPVEKYCFEQIKPVADSIVVDKYSYLVNSGGIEKCVVFFLSPCQSKIYEYSFFEAMLIEIIGIVKNYGYKVFIKGHPRMGAPSFLLDYVDYEIPAYIPAEFINLTNVTMCFGLESTAICYFSKNGLLPTYTLLKMFKTPNADQMEIYIEYLMQQSNNKMLFCNDIVELENILKNSIKRG